MHAAADIVESLEDHRQHLNALGAATGGPVVVGVRSLALVAPHADQGREGNWHSHARGQLLSVEDGMVRIRSPHGTWLAPPRRAVWIPPHVPHAASARGVTRSWNLYLLPEAARKLPDRACVVSVSGLLRELVLRVVSWPASEELDEVQQRVLAVLLDEVVRLPQEALHLPMPTDRRLLRIVDALLDDLGRNRDRDDWARSAGMSVRSLGRMFQQEVGMSFAQWRQLARLLSAVERLVVGESVNAVSDTLGYASPSNFIAMFRRHFGDSPGRYISGVKHYGTFTGQ